jgi:hypothetical protein
MNLEMMYTPAPSQVGALVLDVLVSEKFSFKADVTEFPIESGSEASDHVITKPERISISGLISNTYAIEFAGDGGIKHSNALDTLRFMINEKLPMTVITGMTRYHDMVIESIEGTRTADKGGNWLDLSFELVQISKVSLRTTEIAEERAATSARGRAGTTAQAAGRTTTAGGTPLGPPAPPTSALYRGVVERTGPIPVIGRAVGLVAP